MPDKILLIHGLAENSRWMSFFELSLRAAGYDAAAIDYPSTSYSMEELMEQHIKPFIDTHKDAESLHFVTHSMGGILLHHFLSKYNLPNRGRVVMLTPGFNGSPTITVLSHFPWFENILGQAGMQSADNEYCFSRNLPPVEDYEVGIVAGNLALDPISWFAIEAPNDGKTSIEGTKIDGMKDHIVLPVSHDTVLASPIALYQTLYFLEHGYFAQVEALFLKPLESAFSLF